jgi:hypothetical protein
MLGEILIGFFISYLCYEKYNEPYIFGVVDIFVIKNGNQTLIDSIQFESYNDYEEYLYQFQLNNEGEFSFVDNCTGVELARFVK